MTDYELYCENEDQEQELEDIVGTSRYLKQQEKEKHIRSRKSRLTPKYTKYDTRWEATTQEIKSNNLTNLFNRVKGIGNEFYFSRSMVEGFIEPEVKQDLNTVLGKDKDKDIEIYIRMYNMSNVFYKDRLGYKSKLIYTFFNKKTLYRETFELNGDKTVRGKELEIRGDIHTVNDYLVKQKVSTKYYVTDSQVKIARANDANKDINWYHKEVLENYLVYGYFSKYFNTFEEVYEDYLKESGQKPSELHDSTISKAKNRISKLIKFHKNNNLKRKTKHRDHYISYDTSTRNKTRMVLHELKGLYNSPAYKEGSSVYDYVQEMSDEEFDDIMGGISKDSYFGVPILDDTLGDKAQILTKKTNEYIWT